MTYIFQHIPRTGGITLLSIVREVYDNNDIIIDIDGNNLCYKMHDLFYLQKSPKAIFGHLPFGIHKLLDGEFSYITVMRDPVERIKSVINHLNESNILNVEEYLKNYSQNDMTKAFVYKPHTKNEEDHLEEAKDNIKKYYTIGFTSNFKTFVKSLGKKLGWTPFYYINKNESRPLVDFTKNDIKEIKEKNQLDIKLYEWAKKEF